MIQTFWKELSNVSRMGGDDPKPYNDFVRKYKLQWDLIGLQLA